MSSSKTSFSLSPNANDQESRPAVTSKPAEPQDTTPAPEDTASSLAAATVAPIDTAHAPENTASPPDRDPSALEELVLMCKDTAYVPEDTTFAPASTASASGEIIPTPNSTASAPKHVTFGAETIIPTPYHPPSTPEDTASDSPTRCFSHSTQGTTLLDRPDESDTSPPPRCRGPSPPAVPAIVLYTSPKASIPSTQYDPDTNQTWYRPPRTTGPTKKSKSATADSDDSLPLGAATSSARAEDANVSGNEDEQKKRWSGLSGRRRARDSGVAGLGSSQPSVALTDLTREGLTSETAPPAEAEESGVSSKTKKKKGWLRWLRKKR